MLYDEDDENVYKVAEEMMDASGPLVPTVDQDIVPETQFSPEAMLT